MTIVETELKKGQTDTLPVALSGDVRTLILKTMFERHWDQKYSWKAT